jgi:hypothetical protein
LAAAKWLGYWLLASAIGLAAAKGLGLSFWLQLSGWAIGFWLLLLAWLLAWLWLSDLALAFGFSYWLGCG